MTENVQTCLRRVAGAASAETGDRHLKLDAKTLGHF